VGNGNQSGAGARIVRRSADTGSLLKEAARALLGRPLPLIDRHYTRRRTLLGPDPLVNSSIRRSAMPLACSMKCRARGRARHTGLTPLPEARRSAPLSGSRRRDHPADALVAAPRSGVPRSEEVRFAMDSPLEGDGFEPSVPRKRNTSLWAAPLPSSQFAFRNENRLLRDRDRWFESITLQRRVGCEPDFRGRGAGRCSA
jgi:hypothetical protein